MSYKYIRMQKKNSNKLFWDHRDILEAFNIVMNWFAKGLYYKTFYGRNLRIFIIS